MRDSRLGFEFVGDTDAPYVDQRGPFRKRCFVKGLRMKICTAWALLGLPFTFIGFVAGIIGSSFLTGWYWADSVLDDAAFAAWKRRGQK